MDYDKRIVKEWMQAKELLDKELAKKVASMDGVLLPEVISYIVDGGKRFRGFITLTVAQALGGDVDNATDAAIAIELVHSASLALDDMADMDIIRRGRPSAWVAYNTSKAAMASLLMIAVAQKMVEAYGFNAIKSVIRAWEDTVKGEIMDAYMPHRLTKEHYIKVIELKTASLFRLSSELGVYASGDTRYLENLSSYGRILGIIYQISDDMADYIRHTQSDRRLDPTERIYAEWIGDGDGRLDLKEIAVRTIEVLRSLEKQAVSMINPLPDSRYKDILQHLPTFIARKMLEESRIEWLATLF